MRIFAFHLLNDLSGSPKVLSQVLKGFVEKGEEVHLVSSMRQEGFLSNIEGVQYVDNTYVFHQNVLLRLFKLFYVQLYMILKLYKKIERTDVIYINTVLPFGGAVLGKLKGCKVVYHLHETSMKPALLKKFLFYFVKKMGSEAIYVSHFLKNTEPVGLPSHVIYNSLERNYFNQAKLTLSREKKDRPKMLMICSLKEYKGVLEFLELAQEMTSFDFNLIVNATQTDIDEFFQAYQLPSNLHVFPKQKNVAKFYEEADVLMNLSRPDQWVETFGLTVIEAMAYGVPAIVPQVGGIAELVDDGVNGFKVSCYDGLNLKKSIIALVRNKAYYAKVQKNCLEKANQFSEEQQINSVHKVLQNL